MKTDSKPYPKRLLNIPLTEEQYEFITELAHVEYRTREAQAAWLLREALEKRGFKFSDPTKENGEQS
jgi:hypothetical protein